MDLLLVILFATILGVAALGWGVDSSDSSSDPRRPAQPVGLN